MHKTNTLYHTTSNDDVGIYTEKMTCKEGSYYKVTAYRGRAKDLRRQPAIFTCIILLSILGQIARLKYHHRHIKLKVKLTNVHSKQRIFLQYLCEAYTNDNQDDGNKSREPLLICNFRKCAISSYISLFCDVKWQKRGLLKLKNNNNILYYTNYNMFVPRIYVKFTTSYLIVKSNKINVELRVITLDLSFHTGQIGDASSSVICISPWCSVPRKSTSTPFSFTALIYKNFPFHLRSSSKFYFCCCCFTFLPFFLSRPLSIRLGHGSGVVL